MLHLVEFKYRQRRGDRIVWASDLGELDVAHHDWQALEAEQPRRPNALADEGENNILDVYLRAATAPTTFYLGLLNSTPTDTTTLATMTSEPSTGGYARQQITRDSTGWPTLALDSGDHMATATVETFTASGATIGPVTYAFLCTNAASGTSGKFLVYNALSASRTLNDGDSLDVTMRVKLA
jgi:hypothetical protein